MKMKKNFIEDHPKLYRYISAYIYKDKHLRPIIEKQLGSRGSLCDDILGALVWGKGPYLSVANLGSGKRVAVFHGNQNIRLNLRIVEELEKEKGGGDWSDRKLLTLIGEGIVNALADYFEEESHA